MSRVLLGIPTYAGQVTIGTLQSVYSASSAHRVDLAFNTCSLLGHGFNQLWVHAVMESAADWFAMIHADVAAPSKWLDELIARAEHANADVCAAHLAIKAPPPSAQHGHTSSAWLPDEGPPVALTIDHLRELPQTIAAADLARYFGQPGKLGINTGCWVARLGGAWTRAVHFTISSTINWNRTPPECLVLSEDWRFSHLAAAAGAHLVATRLDNVGHIGTHTWTLPDDDD